MEIASCTRKLDPFKCTIRMKPQKTHETLTCFEDAEKLVTDQRRVDSIFVRFQILEGC